MKPVQRGMDKRKKRKQEKKKPNPPPTNPGPKIPVRRIAKSKRGTRA